MRALSLVLLLAGCAGVQVVPLPKEAELHRARTDDGWELSLVRYRAVGAPKGPPVLLCHGISANERNMDLDDEHSMARWFAAHGREAWTMSLRATGLSDGPDAAKGRGAISFDDYWRHDLPAAIDFVRRTSGAAELDYAGHSMGGMVLYAYLAQGGKGVRAAATLGSPTRLDWGTSVETLALTFGPVLASDGAQLPSALGSRLIAPFQGGDDLVQRLFHTPESTSLVTWRRLLTYGTADTAGGTAKQLLALMRTGDFRTSDGRDLRADMKKITTPILVVAGRLDRIAVAPAVMDGYRALGGPKQWLLVTRANGSVGEYGHMDLVIGERAGDEVWAKILAFFEAIPQANAARAE
ncbi:MAG: alpha/beta fold hydrolase [Myxococcota bacterium]